jgi:hypothetical protein
MAARLTRREAVYPPNPSRARQEAVLRLRTELLRFLTGAALIAARI